MSKQTNKTLINPIENIPKIDRAPIDIWEPACKQDEIFRTVKGAIILDVSSFYGMEGNTQLDAFIMSTKRSYNNPEMRDHITKYLNYFEKFYDTDRELLTIYCRTKYLIDYVAEYTKEAFIHDLFIYIMNGSISTKIGFMNRDCYSLNLTYRNIKNPNLQYSD